MDIAHNAIEKATDTPFLPIILTFTLTSVLSLVLFTQLF